MELVDGRRVFYINYLFTAKQFRKKGFASRLMNHVDKIVLKMNCDGTMLTCDTETEDGTNAAYNFYLSKGVFSRSDFETI